MTDFSEIISAARMNGGSEQLDLGGYYIVPTADGRVERIDLTDERYRDAPQRKKGIAVVQDAASFVAYYQKHGDEGSEVYADRDASTVTAVLDAHTMHGPRFGSHRVVLELAYSEPFRAWKSQNGRHMSQVAFAEWIEDHRPDIRVPAAAELLELATTFQATTKASFKSGAVLQSGARSLEYVEEVNASAGKGKLTIPDSFTLGLPIYEGATVADEIRARLRYRINGGTLAMFYLLDDLDNVIRAAFQGVIDDLAAGLGEGVTILRGRPA